MPGSTDRDRGYWRDVGTLASYYAAHMDLVSVLPIFNLYNYAWPIYTSYGPQPPAKLVRGSGGRAGPGVRRGALARRRGDRRQRQSVGPLALRARGDRGRGHRLGAARRRAGGPRSGGPQRDRGQGVVIPDGEQLGVDPDADRARGLQVHDGITVMGKDERFPA